MIKLTSSLYATMNERLEQIALTAANKLQYAENSYKAIQDVLQQLKEFILGYEFKDQQEEVLFFKEIKPGFLKELIYYREIFYIEAGKPLGDKGSQAAYYKQVSDRINTFFERNHVLYIYYRMGKSNSDNIFFVRGADNDHLQPEYSLDIDARFSTVHSFKFAKIQAYEIINDYLQTALYMLDNPDAGSVANEKKKNRSLWTDTKAALIELAYAIHSRGSVNHGKGDVKQLINDLELLFNVQVGNFYRTFQSMRIRKKNRTAYLEALKESLERRMDDTDLNFL